MGVMAPRGTRKQFNFEPIPEARRALRDAITHMEEAPPSSYCGKINLTHLGNALLLWLADQEQGRLWDVLGPYMEKAALGLRGATSTDISPESKSGTASKEEVPSSGTRVVRDIDAERHGRQRPKG